MLVKYQMMNECTNVLFVSRTPAQPEFVSALHLKGYEITQKAELRRALIEYRRRGKKSYSVILVSTDLPGTRDFIRAVRKRNEYVIIMVLLTRKYSDDFRIEYFKCGVDTVVPSTIPVIELCLRMEAFLRTQRLLRGNDVNEYILGNIYFNAATRVIIDKTRNISFKLTPRESLLFKVLLDNANSLLKSSVLLFNAWGRSDQFAQRSMDVHVSKIRKIIRAEPSLQLETIVGRGHILRCPFIMAPQ